jgi:ferredoxin
LVKGLICYYSGSGNTRLACRYLAKHIKDVEFDFFDITKGDVPNLEPFAVVGFATFTDFFGPPHLLYTFVDSLPRQQGKPAFALNTYGNLTCGTLGALARIVKTKGFQVIAGHSLHMPESYPPMVATGNGREQHPNEHELGAFNDFIAELNRLLGNLQSGRSIAEHKPRLGLANRLIPAPPRWLSRKMMASKSVDESLCIECGVCKRRCPYGAIELAPKPVFDTSKCNACWACYNHCPKHAIYTRRYRGVGHYPKPIEQLKEKLAI